MKPKALAILMLTALVASACSSAASTTGPKVAKIGVELPLSGAELPNGDPTLKGVQLAIEQNPVAGYDVQTSVKDDALNGKHDPQTGATNIGQLVSDSSVFAVVGPFNSNVAQAEIPVSNSAGLIQCSPANTNPSLTKGDTAKALRKDNPDKISYVRVATTDDIQGQAGADIAYTVAKAKSAYVVDDTETYGKGIADAFAAEWTKLGGQVVGREGAPKGTTDYTAILTKFKDAAPDAVFYGGVTATGGGLVRKQMPQVGLDKIAYLGGDGIQDGPGSVEGSFINIAGAAAANSFSSVAAIAEYPGKADFDAKYKAAYNEEAGAYSASGYACAQILLQAIKTAASKGDVTRESVRAAGVDTNTTFETVLGPVKFDAVGDTNQKIISLYKTDLTAASGKGDWVFDSQVDYK